MWNGAQVGEGVYCRGQAGESEAFAPDPADPGMDTRASQRHREKEETGTSEHSLTHGAPCTARDRARGWWAGGWLVFSWQQVEDCDEHQYCAGLCVAWCGVSVLCVVCCLGRRVWSSWLRTVTMENRRLWSLSALCGSEFS